LGQQLLEKVFFSKSRVYRLFTAAGSLQECFSLLVFFIAFLINYSYFNLKAENCKLFLEKSLACR
jgi:hypothetical protein